MKAVIFAGGVGTRLWPLSRKKSPKQFEKIIDNKSTLQIAVERLQPTFAPKDIFISTEQSYVKMVSKQLKDIPAENIIGEPERKDVGPAVAYAMGYLEKKFLRDEPVFISWSDHLVKDVKKFQDISVVGEQIIKSKSRKIVFVGQIPRFPSVNLGYIEFEKDSFKTINEIDLHKFRAFKYRPEQDIANKYFKDKKHCWNLGYFITTPGFILDAFNKLAPDLYSINTKIFDSFGSQNFKEVSKKYYSQMPSIHLDNAILEKLEPEDACVIVEDIGWSDVGAWEALKEALESKKSDNIINGEVMLKDSTDNLVYNYDEDKLIVGIDLEDMLIVNSNDVLLVTKKKSVSKIKTLVESFQGTENEKLT